VYTDESRVNTKHTTPQQEVERQQELNHKMDICSRTLYWFKDTNRTCIDLDREFLD